LFPVWPFRCFGGLVRPNFFGSHSAPPPCDFDSCPTWNPNPWVPRAFPFLGPEHFPPFSRQLGPPQPPGCPAEIAGCGPWTKARKFLARPLFTTTPFGGLAPPQFIRVLPGSALLERPPRPFYPVRGTGKEKPKLLESPLSVAERCQRVCPFRLSPPWGHPVGPTRASSPPSSPDENVLSTYAGRIKPPPRVVMMESPRDHEPGTTLENWWLFASRFRRPYRVSGGPLASSWHFPPPRLEKFHRPAIVE